jgi:hypothetical protein
MAKTSSAHSRAASDEISQPARTLSKVSDIAIARAVGGAVRATPMVLDLSPGIVELAVTYGPHERVTGVVVRHPNSHDITIEVHVVLQGSLRDGSQQDKARGGEDDSHCRVNKVCRADTARSLPRRARAGHSPAGGGRRPHRGPTGLDVSRSPAPGMR